jgi:hypothetical protein
MKNSIRLSALGLAVVLGAGVQARAAGPVLNIPPAAAASGLREPDRKLVDDYVQFWVKSLVTATDANTVADARKSLSVGYTRYGPGATDFHIAYAISMAAQVRKALGAPMPPPKELAGLKEVNLAISAGRMPQPLLQPLANAMVAHRDPAVRLLGWSAYFQLRAPLLAEGGKSVADMYAVLDKSLASETDGEVLSEMMAMFRMSPAADPNSGVPAAAYRAGQEKAYELLRKNWTRVCRQVMAGEPAAAEAAMTGATAVGLLTTGLGATADKKASLQMMLNLAYAGGNAYDQAALLGEAAAAAREAEAAAKRAAGPAADAAAKAAATKAADKAKDACQKAGVEPAAAIELGGRAEFEQSALAVMLLEAERLLNLFSDKGEPGERWMKVPLTAAKMGLGERGANVHSAALNWVNELAKLGLTNPSTLLAPPASAPAAPATAPAKPKAK